MPEEHQTISLPDTTNDAWNSIFVGVLYFVKKKPKYAIPIITLICGSVVAIGMMYWVLKNNSVELKRAEPIKGGLINQSFSIMPQATAGLQRWKMNPIYIDGQLYGYADTTFSVWKLQDKDALLVHDHQQGVTIYIDAPQLERSNLKQYK